MIGKTRNERKGESNLCLPFTLASILRIEGSLNQQTINEQSCRLIFYQREEKVYLAFISRVEGRSRSNSVTKIFNLGEDEEFNFIRHRRSPFFTLPLSIGRLRIYFLNNRLDISQGVDEKFVAMIEEAIAANEKKKNRTLIIRRPKKDGGEL